MNNFLIALMAVALIYTKVSAEIKNAYENGINKSRMLLQNLNQKLNENKNKNSKSIDRLVSFQKHNLNLKIDSLKLVILYYEYTEKLIDQFRIIAPDLYSQIDTIRNAYGERTDVYIKFLPEEKMIERQLGRTIMGQCFEDENICFSEYGLRSVLIKIYSEIKPLYVLAHEFGHVKYQVPHLAIYFNYFKETYYERPYEPYLIGHYPTDFSGIAARKWERKFYQYFNIYKKKLKSNIKGIAKDLNSR